MTLRPAFDQTSRRLRVDLRKHGCVVLSGLAALVHAGMKRPDDVDDAAWGLFGRSGETLAGFRKDGISLDQLATAIKATPSGDRLPWRIQRRRGVRVATTLRDQLREHADAVAVVCIRRGVIVRAGRATGYRGDHGIVIAYHSDDKAAVADSLIPGDVRLWEWDLLADAMDSFGDKPWGGGRGEALVMWPSPTWASEVARYRGLMQRARDQRDDSRARHEATTLELNRCLATQAPVPAEVLAALEAAAKESDRVAGNLVASSADLKRQATSLRAVVTTQEGP